MKINVRWVIGLSLICIVALLILSQSLKTGEESRGLSYKIASYISDSIYKIKGEHERSVLEIELIIRKFAHLIEYILYSTIVFNVFAVLIKSNVFILYATSLVFTVPIPIIDELLIQRMTQGRTSQLLDIGIDLFGIFLGLCIGVIYHLIFSRLDLGKKSL